MSMTPVEIPIIPKIRKNAILTFLSRGTRVDERSFDSPREINIKTDLIPNANGSSYVELGKTKVLAGIKVEPGTPFPDTPQEGNLIVSVEFLPHASPVFEPGPPDERAVELARIIDRSLRDVRAIDLSKMVITPGRKVWNIFIDIYVVDYDGNMIDASSIATMLALLTAKIPKVSTTETGEIIISEEKSENIPVKKKVVTATIAKITDENTGNKYYIADPSLEEEMIADTLVTIAFSEDGLITGIQKSGLSSIYSDDIPKILNMSRKLAEKYLAKINEYITSKTSAAAST
ncbi:MAG: exosome complex protein Rrp42 [Desulfurococcaceae archaeon]|nr:exosome complex protein Rrp42 [Desulfurococcaceae archaeon]